MKGIILAGGKGMRMRPYTETVPKPMLEVAGKPILCWLVNQLGAAGVADVVLMESYLSHVICDYFDSATDLQANVTHLLDKKPNHGTAELIKIAAAEGSGVIDDAVIMAGDTMIDVDYRDVIDFHISTGALVTVIGRREKLSHGIFDCDDTNKILSVSEKPSVVIPTATMIVDKSVIERIDDHGDFFLNIVPYIEEGGYLYEVDAQKVMHISERRDDLALVNEKWAELIAGSEKTQK